MVSSMTCASHKDIQWFLRLDSCFGCPHMHLSFRQLSRVKKTMEECSADCCAESVFPWDQIHTATSTVGETSSTFSLCEQHSKEVGVLAGVAVSKAVQTICSHGSKPSSNQDQSTGGARVAFVRGCINQFDIHVVQTACREGWRSSADYCFVRCARITKP